MCDRGSSDHLIAINKNKGKKVLNVPYRMVILSCFLFFLGVLMAGGVFWLLMYSFFDDLTCFVP